MAVLRAKEIRAMDEKEREEKLRELRAELAKEKSRAVLGGSEKPANARGIRRSIARILTISSEEK